MAKAKPQGNPKKSPAWKRLVKVGRDGVTAAPPAREVAIVLPDGSRTRVNCFRAARLITEGAAQPGPWDKADLEAVEAADTLRKQRQVDTLRRDGLLVNDGASGYIAPVSLGSLREMFGSLFWRER